MKFKWRKWTNVIVIGLLITSSFSLLATNIYYFSYRELGNNNSSNLLPAPIFDQTEINQITTPWGIKLDLFKALIGQKTPAEITHYYVDNESQAWKINITYSWENQNGNWIYELKYH